MEPKFTVGELAKLNGLTKQMLIYYDKEDVFKPRIVDENNGYRYYVGDQLEELDTILLLREMGLSLKEIKAYMKKRNSINTLAVLKQQKAAVNQKIKQWMMIEERLKYKIDSLEAYYATLSNNSIFINLDEEYLAIEQVGMDNGILAVDIAVKKLLKFCSDNNYKHYYQIGDIVDRENILKGNFINFKYAILPLLEPCVSERLLVKPSGLYAHAYHIGSYQSIADTYKLLLSDIAKAGYQIIGDAYEFCILDNLVTSNNNEYITEIQMPVAKIE